MSEDFVKEILEKEKIIHDIISKTLVFGSDYMVMKYGKKGREKEKASFLKPVFARLCDVYGYVITFEILDKETDHFKIVDWVKKGYENKPDTPMQAPGYYRYLIKCTLIKDQKIVSEGIGAANSFESKFNEKPRESENNIVKIAKKRAFMDAAAEAFPLSNSFCEKLIRDKYKERNNQEIHNKEILFNPRDPGHVKFLEGAMEKEKLEKELWPEVIKRMEGKGQIAIGPTINEVKVLASARKAVGNEASN